jgi:hypothetical protein
MPDTDNWDKIANTCRVSSFQYTVVMSRPTSFVETYIHLLLALILGKTLYYQNCLGYQCVSTISHILHLYDNHLTCYFMHLSMFLWVYKLINLLHFSVYQPSLSYWFIYTHTILQTLAVWKHLTRQLKRISKHADKGRILIRSSRLAELYNAPLCTLPLDPTSQDQ